MINLAAYNQQDPRWGAKPLGSSALKMADSGCYVTTCASILASHMKLIGGQPVNPGTLCDWLNANRGFDQWGQLEWSSIRRLFPDCAMVRSCWTENSSIQSDGKTKVAKAIDDIKRYVRAGMATGICVDLIGNDRRPDHIVVCKDAPDDLSQWKIIDPDGGRDIRFVDRYGSPLTGVMGYRLLIGPPVTFPDYSTDADMRMGGAIAQTIDARYTKTDILNQLIGS